MTNKEVIDAMNRMKISQTQSHDDLIKLLTSNHSLTVAEIGALQDKMNIQFNEVNRRLDIANGTIKEHTGEITKLKLADEIHITACPVIPEIRKLHDEVKVVEGEIIGPFIRKHWKSLIAGLLLLLFASYSLFEFFQLTAKDIIEIIK